MCPSLVMKQVKQVAHQEDREHRLHVLKCHPPVAVQCDDVERHSGDMHGEPLGVGQQEAKCATKFPLTLQGVDEGEGEAQSVDQQVGWR